MRLTDRSLVVLALEQYAKAAINFVDAYNLVLMRRRQIARIYSYDTDFDGLQGLQRVEP